MTISSYDDIIDSRDIIERIEELTEHFEELSGKDVGDFGSFDKWVENLESILEYEEPDLEELVNLIKLAQEAEGYCPDWSYGATLIHEKYFTEYCMDLLLDIGDLPREIPHYIVIDEEATAENLKVDYTELDFNGEVYYIR